MNVRALLTTIALTAACSGTPPPASEPPPPTTVTAPATCAVDADCEMRAGPACSCLATLTSAPPTTEAVPPCFVAPCMNHEAYCDAASHACMVRAVMPPPPSSGAPSLDDIPAVS